MPEANDLCFTCGKSFTWHEENRPIHPFNTGQAGATAFLGQKPPKDGDRSRRVNPDAQDQRVVWPTDPVLRIALMNAGLISADQLRAAEEQLRTAMGAEAFKRPPVMRGASSSLAQGEESTGT